VTPVLTAAEIDADPTVFMRNRKPVDQAKIRRRLVGKTARRTMRIRELRRDVPHRRKFL
jgi:hypothetical protein